MSEKSLYQSIWDLRIEGDHPLLQYDILCAVTLRNMLAPEHPSVDAWTIARILKQMEMRGIGLVSVTGLYCHLWTCLPAQPRESIIARARERMVNGAVHLQMEIVVESGQTVPPAAPRTLFNQLERDVMALRVQRYQPRRMALVLRVPVNKVYAAQERIRKSLNLPSLKDPMALRAAVRVSGVLMDDPAFQ